MTTADKAREDLVRQSSHSALLDGLTVSASFEEDSDEYIADSITADQLVERTRQRFGLAARR